jgi:hypothetical protein
LTEIDQVGIDFAIVVSQPVGVPHQILDDGNRLIEGKANRSVGLRVNERRSAGRAKPSDIFGAKCSATSGQFD